MNLAMLCQLSHEAAAMNKPFVRTTRPLIYSSDDELRSAASFAASTVQSSFDTELVTLSETEESAIWEDTPEEGPQGYLADVSGKLAKLKRNGYEKMIEAGELVDTRFIAGLATAVGISAVVWLVTASVKKEKAQNKALLIDNVPAAATKPEVPHGSFEVKKPFAAVAEMNVQSIEVVQEHEKLLIEAQKRAHESDMAELNRKLQLLEKVIEAEQAEKQELQRKLAAEVEENKKMIEVNQLMAQLLQNPQDFFNSTN